MKTIKLIEAMKDLKGTVISLIKRGAVFIYPTDTIYGLGCNAEVAESVWKIRAIKGTQHPFSVIAPSREWIEENLVVKHSEYLEKLPGPYTLVLEKKKPILKETSRLNTLGVRIPNHPFTKIIQEAGVPFITTSVNPSGKEPVKQVSEIPEEIANRIDIAIDAGVLNNPSSTVFDLTEDEPKKLR